MTTKDKLVRFLDDTPVKKVMKTSIEGYDVYVADGFITPEMYRGAEIKFFNNEAIDRDEHPHGCYFSLWWADTEKLGGPGGAATSNELHQMTRLGALLKVAKEDLRKWRGRKRH